MFRIILLFSLMGFSAMAQNSLENEGAQALRVISEKGEPLAQVRVLLESNLFTPESYETDENGEFSIPKDWTEPTTVTLQKTGYIQKSYVAVAPVSQVFKMAATDGQQLFEVAGNTTGYGSLPKDGQLDFSLIIPAMSKSQILGFDMSTVISPQSDTLDIPFYTLKVPSNLSIPRQKERYIFTITFDKPAYRSFVRKPGNYKFVALHGQFPLKKVADDMRNNKSIFEVINDFTMINAGVNEVNVNQNTAGQNIAINQIAFSDKVTVSAPGFYQDKVMLAIAVKEENGLFLPTDLKRVNSLAKMDLKVTNNQDNLSVISILMNNQNLNVDSPDLGVEFFRAEQAGANLKEMSAVLQAKADLAQAPKFLGLISAPTFFAYTLRSQIPELPEGLKPVAMRATLSAVRKIAGDNGTQSEIKTRQWEFYSDNWTDQIAVPIPYFPDLPDGHVHRFEVLYLAAPSEESVQRENLDKISHISRNAIEF